MDKEQFLDVSAEDWWLVAPEPEQELKTARENLGRALGFEGDLTWYTQREKLEKAWEWVERSSDLMRALDEAGDLREQTTWMESLAEAASPAPAKTVEQVSAPVEAAVPVVAPPESPAPVQPKRSLFGRKGEDPASESSTEETLTATTAPTPSSGGPEESAPKEKSSIFGRKRAAAPESGSSSTQPSEALTVMSPEDLRVAVGKLSENPDFSVAAPELEKLLADPELPSKVAQAAHELETELLAELNEAAV